jgi:hypothetical protein
MLTWENFYDGDIYINTMMNVSTRRFQKLFILYISVLLFIPQATYAFEREACNSPELIEDADLLNDDFDQTLNELMMNAHLPSLAVGIIRNDTLVWSQGYGEHGVYACIHFKDVYYYRNHATLGTRAF